MCELDLIEKDIEKFRENSFLPVIFYVTGNIFVIYLTLAECGFMSNREEADKLATKEYQEKVAEAVCAGVMEYLGK